MTIRSCLLCFLALATSACATMSEDECRTADWRTIGYEDGAAGRSAAVLGTRREACAEHGVIPDLDAYRSGRDVGLREFCQPHNGYNLGTRGNSYDGVCPADLEAAFVAAYTRGQELYRYTSRVSQADSSIAAKQRELDALEEDLRENEALLVSSDATRDQRAEALLAIKDYAQKKGRLESEIRQLEQDRARYVSQLEAYRDQSEYGP
ncbi:MAG: DUF2799 domain-containing protein [Gammaproteobacteria bacterium]